MWTSASTSDFLTECRGRSYHRGHIWTKNYTFSPQQGPACRDFRRAFRLYSSPLSLQQDGKTKTNPEDAAYGEVCVARIGDFVCGVDYLQNGHELDRLQNGAQTLRIIRFKQNQ